MSDSEDLKEALALIDQTPLKFHDMGKSTAQLVDEEDPGSPVVIRDEKGRDRILMTQADYRAVREPVNPYPDFPVSEFEDDD